jgi:hypothetical protein
MTTARNEDPDTGAQAPADHTAQAVEAMLAAVAIASGDGQDFAEWLSHVLARVAAMSGGVEALVAGRPGSWESDKVRDFVHATAGDRPGDLEAFLPEGFHVPLGSVALYESDDNTLWLVTRPWDGTDDQPATVYVRRSALQPEEVIYADGRVWLVDQSEIDPFRWRELGAGDVAEAFAHAGADMHEGQPAPGRLLGTLYRDRAAAYDGGVYFDVLDRDYLHSRPLAVQRYCQTDHAAQLEDAELEAVGQVLDELAVLAGEHGPGDLADGVTFGVDVEDRAAVSLLYALALGLARNDDAKYTRAQQLKFDYEAWWTRWHDLYTDAQPAGVNPMGL